MKVKVNQAIQAVGALQRLSSAPFPARDAYKIARMIVRIRANEEVMATEQTRVAMIRKHGSGGDSVLPENFESFLEEYQPIADREIELDVLPLPFSIFDHAPEITPSDMVLLEPFICEPVDPSPQELPPQNDKEI